MGSKGIKRVSSTKTLGVVVDECITWRDHVDIVAKSDWNVTEMAKQLFDRDTLKTIYNAFLLTHFDCCALVWNNGSKTLQKNCKNSKIKPVELLQLIAIKLPQILSGLDFLGTS